jgi:hypothetical protein
MSGEKMVGLSFAMEQQQFAFGMSLVDLCRLHTLPGFLGKLHQQ